MTHIKEIIDNCSTNCIVIKQIESTYTRHRVEKVKKKIDTPPTPAAMEGAIKTLAFLSTSTASGVQGMFEPKQN